MAVGAVGGGVNGAKELQAEVRARTESWGGMRVMKSGFSGLGEWQRTVAGRE